MGVERAVTRWYALRQNIEREIEVLNSQLEPAHTPALAEQERDEVTRQLAEAQARLRALGPCPKAMMG